MSSNQNEKKCFFSHFRMHFPHKDFLVKSLPLHDIDSYVRVRQFYDNPQYHPA